MSVNPFTLPLDLVVNVAVYTAPQAAPRRTFNQLLVIGSSMGGQTPVIPSSERVRQYTDTKSMLTDGFTINSPEYKAAQLYFSQDVQGPAPTILWVGCQDPSAIETWELDPGNVGSGYAIGDILTVTQSGAAGGQFQVTSVGVGAITAMALDVAGSGYHANDILAIAGGVGGTYKVLTVDGSGVIQTGEIHAAGTGYTATTGAATTATPTGGTGATITITVPHVAGEVEAVIQIAKGTGYSGGNRSTHDRFPFGRDRMPDRYLDRGRVGRGSYDRLPEYELELVRGIHLRRRESRSSRVRRLYRIGPADQRICLCDAGCGRSHECLDRRYEHAEGLRIQPDHRAV